MPLDPRLWSAVLAVSNFALLNKPRNIARDGQGAKGDRPLHWLRQEQGLEAEVLEHQGPGSGEKPGVHAASRKTRTAAFVKDPHSAFFFFFSPGPDGLRAYVCFDLSP